jgi:hypothetical protein
MNRTIVMLALVSVLSLGLVASQSYASGTTGRSGFKMFDSYDVIGAQAKDSHGELIGFVNEVMLDSRGHALAVIYHETGAGEDPLLYGGGESTPVPFQELTISKAKGSQEAVVLKTDLRHLDFAPYLDPFKTTSRPDEAKIYEYYGIQPYWVYSGTPVKGAFMEVDSRDLVGAAVENSCGKVIGIVNEVMVDTRGHAFAIINHGDYDLYGDGGVNTPVPIQELQISKTKAGQDIVFLKTDTEHLDFAPYLNSFQTNSRQYEANIYEYYGIQPYWTRTGE